MLNVRKIPVLLLAALVLIPMTGFWSTQTCEAKDMQKENVKAKKEGGMSGIVFFKTKKLEELKKFYIEEVGASMWMDQGDCVILRFGTFLFGFCQRDKADLDALITFFYEKKEAVDRAYEKFKETAVSPPKMNPNYPIYNFFARDPEGRTIEFQYFTGPIDWTF
jgi:hypothetical protein